MLGIQWDVGAASLEDCEQRHYPRLATQMQGWTPSQAANYDMVRAVALKNLPDERIEQAELGFGQIQRSAARGRAVPAAIDREPLRLDYVALLAYLEMSRPYVDELQRMRRAIRDALHEFARNHRLDQQAAWFETSRRTQA